MPAFPLFSSLLSLTSPCSPVLPWDPHKTSLGKTCWPCSLCGAGRWTPGGISAIAMGHRFLYAPGCSYSGVFARSKLVYLFCLIIVLLIPAHMSVSSFPLQKLSQDPQEATRCAGLALGGGCWG